MTEPDAGGRPVWEGGGGGDYKNPLWLKETIL